MDIRSETWCFTLEKTLAAKLSEVGRRRGVSVETLLNLWVQEKLLLEHDNSSRVNMTAMSTDEELDASDIPPLTKTFFSIARRTWGDRGVSLLTKMASGP